MADFTFTPLTPTASLERAAHVFGERVAVVDGDRRFTYREYHQRSHRLTGVLADLGVAPGDRVAALCTNSHVMLEMHHGVPLRGAVLVPLNTRLSEAEHRYILEHSGAKVLVATHELADRARALGEQLGVRVLLAGGEEDEYGELLATAEPAPVPVTDETAPLAINYTSGTTGRPKGVVYHHRGAYLQALAMTFHARLDDRSSYLWTLPMFHCNGWCFTWATAAAAATNVCLRQIDPPLIWQLLRDEGVTHYSAAPTVLGMVANAREAQGDPLPRRVQVHTGGAPPTPTLLQRLDALGMDVTHLYGLTETYGPVALNDWKHEWDDLPAADQARLKARQGVGNVIAEGLRVVDDRGRDVPDDATTVGEIVARGNDVMLGYYRDDAATEAVTVDGWFRTGDLAVMHPDGYVEIKDRSKDIIISGGENIASVEVERVIDEHPDVLESAVVGLPDEKWGQVPVAYVTLRDGADVEPAEIIAHVRDRLARFKAPKAVQFGSLPKTSTGKIQKKVLRAQADAPDGTQIGSHP
jgi:fatty-acyl-CoA synthase